MISAFIAWYQSQDWATQKMVIVGGALITISFVSGVIQGFRSTQDKTRHEIWREPLHELILRRLRGQEAPRTIVERPTASSRVEH